MSRSAVSPPGRRQRRRDRTRHALMQAALRLFAERGYDATTIEDITDAADVAPRTFFHYFASKDEVLFGGQDDRREALIQRFGEEVEHQPVEVALQNALLTIVDAFEDDPGFFLKRAQLYTQWQPLRSAVLRVNEAMVDGLTEVLAKQLGVDPRTELAPRLIATLANGAMRCAIDTWVASGGKADLRALTVRALHVVEPAITAALSSGRPR
ncbi:MAG: TetR family transcriptional regulator [Gemmatimonadota bacterium]